MTKKLKISFVSQAGVSLASHRMRVLHTAGLLNMCSPKIDAYVRKKADTEAHVNIFNKHFDQKGNIAGIEGAKEFGYKTIFDICDDHFDTEKMGVYYRAMCKGVDVITCTTKGMQERIKETTGRDDAMIVADPIMSDFAEPTWDTNTRGTPKLMWYGHATNAPYLLTWLDYLPDNKEVTAICNSYLQHPKVTSKIWQPRLVEKLLPEHDIVLIPTNPDSAGSNKSPNRVMDALNAGKIVITDNHGGVYDEFKECVIVIESPEALPDALSYAVNKRKEMDDMIRKGQKIIKEKYGDDVILDAYLEVLKKLEVIK